MACHLRNWLKSLIDTELRHGLDWLSLTSAVDGRKMKKESGWNDEKFKDLYEDDGSNLRIKITRSIDQKSVVQIVQLSQNKNDFQGTVSDSHTYIRAKFLSSSSSVQSRMSRTGRPFSQSRGGFLSLISFELVATPYGPGDWMLSLFIIAFDWVGSEGQSTVGRPRPITGVESVAEMLQKLRTFREGVEESEDISDAPNASATPPISQPDCRTQNTSHMSQTQFASQIPYQPARHEPEDFCEVGGVNLDRPTAAGYVHGTRPPESRSETDSEKSRNLLRLLDRSGFAATRNEQKMEGCKSSLSAIAGAGEASSSRTTSTQTQRAQLPVSKNLSRQMVGLTPRGDKATHFPAVSTKSFIRPAGSSGQDIEGSLAGPVEVVQTLWERESKQELWRRLGPIREYKLSPSQLGIVMSDQSGFTELEGEADSGNDNINDNLQGEQSHRSPSPLTSLTTPRHKSYQNNSEQDATVIDVCSSSDESGSEESEDDELPFDGSAKGNPTIGTPESQESLLPWPSSPPRPLSGLPPDSSLMEANPLEKQSIHAVGSSSTQAITSAHQESRKMDVDPPPSTAHPAASTIIRDNQGHLDRPETPKLASSLYHSPASSPAVNTKEVDEEDSDLEISIPHALEEPLAAKDPTESPKLDRTSHSIFTQGPEQPAELQAADTPYTVSKTKNDVASAPLSRQRSRELGSSQTKIPETSSAPMIPSTFGLSRMNPQSSATVPFVRSEDEDAISRQFQDEIQAASRRTPPENPPKSTISLGDVETHTSPSISSPPNTTINIHGTQNFKPTSDLRQSPESFHHKRDADHMSPDNREVQKKKRSRINFGFSQEPPVLQDPAVYVKETKRAFLSDLGSFRNPRSPPSSPPLFSPTTHESHNTNRGKVRRNMSPLLHRIPQSPGNESPAPKGEPLLPCREDTATKPSRYPGEAMASKLHRFSSPECIPSKMPARPTLSLRPTEQMTAESAVVRYNVYDAFSREYPDYHGSSNHFYGLCRLIFKLDHEERMEHPSLWDDFIIHHDLEYREKYLRRCGEVGEDPMPYERFYRDKISTILYRKMILNRKTLARALEECRTPSYLTRSARSEGYKGREKRILLEMSPEEPISKRLSHSSRHSDYRSNYGGHAHCEAEESLRAWQDGQFSYRWGSEHKRQSDHTDSHQSTSTGPRSSSGRSLPWGGKSRRIDVRRSLPSRGLYSPDSPGIDSTRNHLPKQSTKPFKTAFRKGNHDVSAFTPVLAPGATPTSSTPRLAHKNAFRQDAQICEEALGSNYDSWYQDPHTPFKEWVKAFSALRSMEGALGCVDDHGILRTAIRPISVLALKK